MRPSFWKQYGWLIALLVIGLGIGGFFLFRYWIRQADLGAFNAKIKEYIGSGAGAFPGGPGQGQVGSIKGKKVLPVDVKAKEVDWVYYDLPDPLRPNRPEEVGAVALLHWGEEVVGKYGASGGNASRQTCHIVVVNHPTRTVVSQATVRGSEPPSSSRGGRSQSGSKPTAEVVNFLRSLSNN
jgi:hypothetical protein